MKLISSLFLPSPTSTYWRCRDCRHWGECNHRGTRADRKTAINNQTKNKHNASWRGGVTSGIVSQWSARINSSFSWKWV